MEMKLGYETEVSMIPVEWNPYKFEQIATIRKKKVDPKRSGRYSFCIEMEHIGQGSGQLIGYSTTTDESSLKAQFIIGDVLFGRLRAYLRKYWLADRDGVCSTEIWPLVPNSDVVTSQYLFQLVQTNQFIEAASTAYGTHMPRTDWDVIKNYEVLLPSLSEQQVISTALSDVDALIASLDRLISKKRDIKQATMQQLLTGKTRLPGFSEEWKTEDLGEITEVVMGQSPLGTSYNRDGYGYPLINGPTEFTDRYPIKIQWTNQPTKFCKKNDVLLCVRGSSTGRINIANDEYCIGRGIAAIRAKTGVDTQYITFQVDCAVKKILALTTGSTFPNIDGKSIRSIEVPRPSFAEQRAIAAILSDMDAEIVALEQKRDKTRALKQGIMQELLTGKTRLV